MLGSFFSFLKEKGVNLDEVEVEIRKPTEDYSDSYNGSTSIQDANAVEVPTNEELPEPDVPKSVLENLSTESLEVKQTWSYNVSTSIQDANAVEVPTNSELPDPDVPKEVLENLSTESLELKQTQTKSNYERTLSGGVQSPRGGCRNLRVISRAEAASQQSQLSTYLQTSKSQIPRLHGASTPRIS